MGFGDSNSMEAIFFTKDNRSRSCDMVDSLKIKHCSV